MKFKWFLPKPKPASSKLPKVITSSTRKIFTKYFLVTVKQFFTLNSS